MYQLSIADSNPQEEQLSILAKRQKLNWLGNNMRDYIFSAYYYHDPTRLVKVKAKTRAKAYDLARAKAIRIKNDLDLIELNEIH